VSRFCSATINSEKKTVYGVCTEMEGNNFGREKDKSVPLEAKREKKNAKGGR